MKCLHIVKTSSYKNDGRLLKWIKSLKSHGVKSDVFIVEDINDRVKSVDNGTSITSVKLISRRFFSKRKGYLFKAPEFAVRSLIYLRKSSADFIVFHDVQNYLTLFFLCITGYKRKKFKIIWDLHELPHDSLSRFALTRRIVQFILQNVDALVYTNRQRRECILSLFSFKEPHFFILNNFPEREYVSSPKAPLPVEVKDNIGNSPYVLWMGNANSTRNFIPVINSLVEYKSTVKVVVMGRIDLDVQTYLSEQNLDTLVFSRFVPQTEIIKYVDNAMFSLVFYKQTSLNNLYCEPNRLYQLITRNIPVIVGNNPPMKSWVEQYDCGIVLDDDGSNEASLKTAVDKMMDSAHRVEFANNMRHSDLADVLSWDDQFNELFPKMLSSVLHNEVG